MKPGVFLHGGRMLRSMTFFSLSKFCTNSLCGSRFPYDILLFPYNTQTNFSKPWTRYLWYLLPWRYLRAFPEQSWSQKRAGSWECQMQWLQRRFWRTVKRLVQFHYLKFHKYNSIQETTIQLINTVNCNKVKNYNIKMIDKKGKISYRIVSAKFLKEELSK